MAKSPEDIARELGLEFTVEKPAQSKIPVLRFTFKFPELKVDAKGAIGSAGASVATVARAFDAPENVTYAETVKRVTKWAARVKAWTFITPDARPVVAAELSFGNRVKVAWVNRATRKALAEYWGEESRARRLALSQPTPMQGVKVLEATPMKEMETRRLRDTLRKSAEILAQPDDPTAPLTSPTAYPYEPPQAPPQSNPFATNQGTGGEIH